MSPARLADISLSMAGSQKSGNRVWYGRTLDIIDRLWAGFIARVPLGYEDETGFHYGIEPVGLSPERNGISKPDGERLGELEKTGGDPASEIPTPRGIRSKAVSPTQRGASKTPEDAGSR
jgi:hypothetical protein